MEHLKSSLESLIDIIKKKETKLCKADIYKFADERLDCLRDWFRDPPFSIYVSGSYGRRTPAPYSDLDLVFLIPSESKPEDYAQWFEEKVYPLYPYFPVIEHAYRKKGHIKEAIEKDFRVFFNLSDAVDLYSGEAFKIPKTVKLPLEDLLHNVKSRWDQYAHSPCLVEMNVKDSPGGLQDYGNYFRLSSEAPKEIETGFETLLVFRALIQEFQGKNKNFSSFSFLRKLDEAFVTKVFQATTTMYLRVREALNPDVKIQTAQNLDEWGALALSSKRKYNFNYLSGAFEKIFPIMSDQLFRCSQSSVHRFTVGWHSSECLKVGKDVVAGVVDPEPIALNDALKFIDQPFLLNLAVFLHDMGKGQGEDHSTWGADWVERELQGQLVQEDRELVAWLVENHLLLHEKAMKEDFLSSEVLEGICTWAQSPRRLSYLYLLTIIDLIATNPKLWNKWRAQMIGQLFKKILDQFLQQEAIEVSPLGNFEIPTEARAFLSTMPDEYRLSRTVKGVSVDCALLEKAQSEEGGAVRIEFDDSVGFEVVTIATKKDYSGLMYVILDHLFQFSLGVWRTRTYSLEKGYLKLFWIYPYGSVQLRLNKSRIQKVCRILRTAISRGPAKLYKKKSVSQLQMQLEAAIEGHVVFQDQEGAGCQFRVNAADREGLLFDLVEIIHRCGFDIQSANIGTTGVRALDTFVLR